MTTKTTQTAGARRVRVRTVIALVVIVVAALGLQAAMYQQAAQLWPIALGSTIHVRIESYTLADGGRSLDLHFWHGDCTTFPQTKVVTQTTDRVVVARTERSIFGCISNLLLYGDEERVSLDAPLGDRPVLDDLGNRMVRVPSVQQLRNAAPSP